MHSSHDMTCKVQFNKPYALTHLFDGNKCSTMPRLGSFFTQKCHVELDVILF